jgi:hypothetical protein
VRWRLGPISGTSMTNIRRRSEAMSRIQVGSSMGSNALPQSLRPVCQTPSWCPSGNRPARP